MKLIAKNKKASFDNEILEKFVAGIVLTGAEVKSVKQGQVRLDGAYVFVNANNAVLRNAHITLWQHANTITKTGYVPDKDRLLLLTKKQLLEIATKRTQMRAQVIPVAIVLDHNLVKVEIAIARPLKKYDKKNRRKELEEKRKVQRIATTVEIQR